MCVEYIAQQQRQQERQQELTERIEICDDNYARFQSEGKSVDALQWLEHGVWLRRDRDGVGSEEVERCAHTLMCDCNTVAMASLQANNFVLAHELLSKALIISEPVGAANGSGLVRQEGPRRRLRAVTYNNLGCFFRKRGKLHSSLQMLDKALRLELLSEQVDTPATTHLNMSAVLSQLHKHRASLEHAQCAVQLLEESCDPRGISGLVQVCRVRKHTYGAILWKTARNLTPYAHLRPPHTHTCSHTLKRAYVYTHTHTHTHTPALSRSLSRSLSYTPIHTHTLSLSVSLTPTDTSARQEISRCLGCCTVAYIYICL